MPGIAFGLSPGKQKIGDVLVAKMISIYGPKRQNADGTVTYRGSKPPSGATLHDRFRTGRGWSFNRPDGVAVAVHSGEILSGEDLVDNLAVREALRADFPNAIGGEMEGAGLYAAADEAKTEWIVVKAICDWADGRKHSRYQPLAAAAAASFIAHVLGQPTVLDGLKRADLDGVDPRPKRGKGAGDNRKPKASPASASDVALEIIAALQSRTTPVAKCIADALALSIRTRDEELRKFCERELSGLREAGYDKRAPDFPKHRTFTQYLLLAGKLDPAYPPWQVSESDRQSSVAFEDRGLQLRALAALPECSSV
jgi:hypothetical protein